MTSKSPHKFLLQKNLGPNRDSTPGWRAWLVCQASALLIKPPTSLLIINDFFPCCAEHSVEPGLCDLISSDVVAQRTVPHNAVVAERLALAAQLPSDSAVELAASIQSFLWMKRRRKLTCEARTGFPSDLSGVLGVPLPGRLGGWPGSP